MDGENFGYIEQQMFLQMHDMNRLVGQCGTISKELLRGHNVIVVTDGAKTGFSIDLAYEFLKPISIEKLIFAVPFSSVEAVDRMHVLADDLYCLNVIEDYRDTDHYYDKKDVPDHATILKTIEHIILNWK
jgi:predicted phosphoribosyltransferase